MADCVGVGGLRNFRFRGIFNFMFKEILLELHKIQNYLVKITRNTKFWQTNFEFREIRGTFRETRNYKFAKIQKRTFRSHSM